MDSEVKIHIHEAYGLCGKDANGTSDPICYIYLGDQVVWTETFYNVISCTWDHMFRLSVPNEDLNNKCTIIIYNANTFRKDDIIGKFTFALHMIQGKPIIEKWVALINEYAPGSPQGYLKVTIELIEGNYIKSQATSPPHEGPDLVEKNGIIMVPDTIELETKQLTIKIYNIVGLPKLDLFGKCDSYIKIYSLNGLITQTQVIDRNYNPVWNTEYLFPVTLPCLEEKIKLEILDYNRLGWNDLISTIYLPFENTKGPIWYPLYTSPEIKSTSKAARDMRAGRSRGTRYAGKLLLEVIITNSKIPILAQRIISPPVLPRPCNYYLRLYLWSLIGCEIKGTYITIGDYMIKVNEKLGGETLLPVIYPEDSNQIPDIIIWNKKRGHIRLSPRSYDPIWRHFKADPDMGQKIPYYGSAFLSITFTHMEIVPVPPVMPELKPHKFYAIVYECENLNPQDLIGTTDSYLLIRFAGAVMRTKTVKSSLFPIFDEILETDVFLPTTSVNGDNNIMVSLYDHDYYSADDYVSKIIIPGTDINGSAKWYEFPNNNGRVLIAFSLDNKPVIANIPEKELNLQVIGFKDLQLSSPVLQMDEQNWSLSSLGKGIKVVTRHNKIPFSVHDMGLLNYSSYIGSGIIRYIEGEENVFEFPIKRYGRIKCSFNDTAIVKKPYKIRIYMIKGIDIKPENRRKTIDTYIVYQFGQSWKFKTRKFNNTSYSPDYYVYNEFEADLPNIHNLIIKVYDIDTFSADDLIGSCELMLENYIDRGIVELERLNLTCPKSKVPQGYLNMKIEVLEPAAAAINPPMPLICPVKIPGKVQIIVWSCRNIVYKDSGKSSDIFVSITCSNNRNYQQTDTHWRSKDHNALFNWSFVFQVNSNGREEENVPACLQVWDRDLIKPSELIGEVLINVRNPVTRRYVPIYHPNFPGLQGEIEIETDILIGDENLEKAKKWPIGQIYPPKRPETSYAPWQVNKMLYHRRHSCTAFWFIIAAIVLFSIFGHILF